MNMWGNPAFLATVNNKTELVLEAEARQQFKLYAWAKRVFILLQTLCHFVL